MKIYFTVLQSVYKKDNPIFLSQSLQSIAENTVQSYSVVLVKDGILNHELESVISEWQSKLPLKVVGYEKNQGLAHALNYGLQFVETELVARMDSDDICFSNLSEKQIAQFEVDSSIEILVESFCKFCSFFCAAIFDFFCKVAMRNFIAVFSHKLEFFGACFCAEKYHPRPGPDL